jgi:hypothetical protein
MLSMGSVITNKCFYLGVMLPVQVQKDKKFLEIDSKN